MASADVLSVPTHDSAFAHFDSLRMSTPKRKRSGSESHLQSPIPEWAGENIPKLEFDATKHLAYSPPSKVWTMNELSKGNQGISPVAVSEPFPLFTEEAVKQMRAEVLSKAVLENCKYSSNLAHLQLRGFAPEQVNNPVKRDRC
jgi:hypothetical protein